ncbi:Protein transport protein sec16 [Caenorhabditis elegans]|uniref:Protein transport protein sec16 n=1 Tax=Caenorhabditis elegans TaxID=6239 RepID=H2KZQ9_CAEEL|nr:Protein transport protein sec16 [Caenorhabditis elegans]CCD69408.1 Protein transport protein sec16 [Caenorhabditis elegans]|eukprot:NP_001024557.1 Protein transport protein sec16 [Caenorhabditis elegans]
MSFYWQQGLPNQQDTGQQSQQPAQQGQWDFINLGGAPAPQHQWNPATQQQNNYYYHQQPAAPPQQHTNPQQPPQQQYNVPTNSHQTAEQNYQQQWAQQQYQNQAQPQPPQQPSLSSQQIQHQPQLPKAKKAPKVQTNTQQQVQQNFNPTPPVLTTSQKPGNTQQDYYYSQQQHTQQNVYQTNHVHPEETQVVAQALQPTAESTYFPPPPVQQVGSAPPSKEVTPERHFTAAAPAPHVEQVALVPTPPTLAPKSQAPNTAKKAEHLTVTAPIAAETPKTKVTPTSSEDDWEKADMEVQRVEDENKRQKAVPSTAVSEKPEESRESSSLGGSWSQQDTEPSERSSVEPEILEHPVKSESDKEEKTPRVSMSEFPNHETTPTIVTMSVSTNEDRQKTPEAGNLSQNTSIVLNTTDSPLEAIATSTPKEIKPEKRSSVSSQGTIGAEKTKAKKKNKDEAVSSMFKRPDQFSENGEASGNNSDSTMASGRPDFERGHARASYREYKKTYKEIIDRLKMMRTDSHRPDFRPASKLANPLLAAAGLSRLHPAIRRESAGGRNDGRTSVPLHHSHSFTEHMYHDQNGGRRSRVSRLDPNARPSSRQATGYQTANQSYNHYDQHNHSYQHQQMQHRGRHSALGVPFDARRTPSSYIRTFSGEYGQEPQETSSISENEDDGDNVESDDELRGFNMERQHERRGYNNAQYQEVQCPIEEDGSALYYCGVVHVNMDIWRRITQSYQIPAEFNELKPIEKAAYIFYAVIHKQPCRNLDTFRKQFNFYFYKYGMEGDSDDDALFKVCRTMQNHYIERQREKERANQNMMSTLFSDDTSIDGQSDMNSVCEESLNAYDIYNNGPLKFTCPHSFMNISTGGQIISIRPDQSISAVVFDDIKSVLKDVPTLQVKDAAMTFKGPLIPHQSAPHTVRLYITKQIENIKNSAVAIENPEANDVVESLLIWQLLETMVKQQGNITGPDIAELLAKVASQPVQIEAPPQQANIAPALTQFTKFLLGGHIDEAVESALRNGLFADALVLTRRLFPNDERRIEQIESRFLQTRSMSNPVTTLVSVAKGESPPVLTNPPLDDHLSWGTHAAIILANLDQRGPAMNTIYQLGRALAKRDYHSAADFCFLVCGVLGGTNPFEPIATPEGEEDYRRHISLVNSDIPDNESNPKCQYGFLLTDLHATEIFDYALRLKADRESPLTKSVEYQTARIKYAKLLANHGFNTDAYRYCTEVARAIWNNLYLFKADDLLELCDLAESLQYAASVNPSESQWIHDLRTTVQAGFVYTPQPTQTVKHLENKPVPSVHQGYDLQSNAQDDPEVPREPVQHVPITQNVIDPVPTHSAFTPTIQPKDPELSHPPQNQVYREEPPHIPPTPTPSVHQEQHYQQFDQSFSQSLTQQAQEDGFMTPPDYSDGPLTMASSPPTLPPVQSVPVSSKPAPPSAENQAQNSTSPQQPTQEQGQETQDRNPDQGGWLKSIQSTVQNTVQKATGRNPMNLPEDRNPSIVWDSTQNKYVGAGVEQEPVAPPPPMAQAGPAPPVGGGGLRAARASRYARVGGTSSSASQAPAGMMAPAPPTANFGFIPAPVDNDNDSVDPFSGQANPTIMQSAPMSSDE